VPFVEYDFENLTANPSQEGKGDANKTLNLHYHHIQIRFPSTKCTSIRAFYTFLGSLVNKIRKSLAK